MSQTLKEQYSQLFSAFTRISDAERARFEKELAAFPEGFKRYMRDYVDMQNQARRAISFELRLRNSGTAIAEDIILNAHIPEKMIWLPSLQVFNPPQPPATPIPPRTQLQLSAHFAQTSAFRPSPQALPQIEPPNPRIKGPFVQGRTVTWEFPNLHHKSLWPLGPIWAHFPDPASVSPFEITFSIRERNTPDIVQGRLLVHIG